MMYSCALRLLLLRADGLDDRVYREEVSRVLEAAAIPIVSLAEDLYEVGGRGGGKDSCGW